MAREYDTHKWRKLREQLLREQPLCVRCSNMGIVRLATVIDHTIPARAYTEGFFDTSNLVPICNQCHSDVTKMYDNRDAWKAFKDYKKVKYSGKEFARDSMGFPLDEDLDSLLLGMPIIDVNESPLNLKISESWN